MKSSCVPSLVLLLFSASSARAESPLTVKCDPDRPVIACIALALEVAPPDVEIAATNSGTDTGRDFSSALTTFVDLLSVQADFLDVAQSKQGISVGWKVPVAGLDLTLQGMIRRPELGADVTEQLSSDPASIETLKGTLSDFDDFQATALVAYSPAVDSFFQNLRGVVRGIGEDSNGVIARQKEFNLGCLKEATERSGITPQSPEVPVRECPDTRARLEKSLPEVRAYATAVARRVSQGAEVLQLLPQTYATATVAARDPLVGSDSFELQIVHEIPTVALGAPACSAPPGGAGVADAACRKAFVEFLDAVAGNVSPLKRLRFAVVASYRHEAGSEVSYPDQNLTLSRPARDSFSLTARLGTFLRGTGGVGSIRVDGDGSLSIRDDSVKTETRAKASLTLSAKISDAITVPVGVVWANKPDLLGDPDYKAGARIGLNFKIPAIL